jgi:hypothetical protein
VPAGGSRAGQGERHLGGQGGAAGVAPRVVCLGEGASPAVQFFGGSRARSALPAAARWLRVGAGRRGALCHIEWDGVAKGQGILSQSELHILRLWARKGPVFTVNPTCPTAPPCGFACGLVGRRTAWTSCGPGHTGVLLLGAFLVQAVLIFASLVSLSAIQFVADCGVENDPGADSSNSRFLS